MKKSLLPILFLLAVAVFVVIPSQKNPRAAPGVSSSPTASPTLSPVGFLLDWSSSSYVPPDYQGKALAARNSLIRVVAAPINSSVAEPEKLFYNWQINSQAAGQNSGLGKSILEFRAAGWPGEELKIRCQIFDASQKLLADKNIAITLAKPQILLYGSTGGYAFKNSVAAKTEQKLRFLAVPFFFRSNSPNDVNYDWQFDGQKLSSPDNKGLDRLTLSVPAGEIAVSFAKQLYLSITDKNDPLQQASVNLQINIQP